MRLLGAEVVPVRSGTRTLKDAMNEAMRDWVTNVETTHYVIGSVAGPHPFPMMVRDFQRIIGVEARQQCLDLVGRLPDALVACVGGGSNAMGLFHPFLDDEGVALVGCEAGGDGVDTGRHAAPLTAGSPGVLHGSRSYLMQDEDGQTLDTTSISAGLDYPGVGPEHSLLRDTGRATYTGISDGWAMQALDKLAKSEGILCAIETAHAFAGACDWGRAQVAAGRAAQDLVIIINTSGRGDKDTDTAARWFGLVTGEEVAESDLVRAHEGEQP
jgi:tryptophan synthase beta chain